MTAISLGQSGRRSRLSSMAITAAIKVGRETSDNDGYLLGPARLREHFEVGNVTSRPHEFAAGFVDFLLGRRARRSLYLAVGSACARSLQ
jgi:hypothetical protein